MLNIELYFIIGELRYFSQNIININMYMMYR